MVPHLLPMLEQMLPLLAIIHQVHAVRRDVRVVPLHGEECRVSLLITTALYFAEAWRRSALRARGDK